MRTKKEKQEMAGELSQPITPKSERPRISYGSLLFQMPGGVEYCTAPRCLKKMEHNGDHWPKERT